jgi:hypothetical protein
VKTSHAELPGELEEIHTEYDRHLPRVTRFELRAIDDNLPIVVEPDRA